MHIPRLDIKNGYVFQIPAAFRTRTYLFVSGAPRRHAALSRAETPRLRALKTCLYSKDTFVFLYTSTFEKCRRATPINNYSYTRHKNVEKIRISLSLSLYIYIYVIYLGYICIYIYMYMYIDLRSNA